MEKMPKTPRGDQYRENHPRLLRDKLFVPRNMEGEPNESAFAIAREFERELSKNEAFVGVTIRGSQMRGYNRTSSDLDMSVLYDQPADSPYPGDMVPSADGVADKVRKQYGQKTHLFWVDINSDKYLNRRFFHNANSYEILGSLCEVGSGPQLDTYREKFADALHLRSKSEQDLVVEGTVEWLIQNEKDRQHRMQRRIPQAYAQGGFEDLMNERRAMWEKRVRTIFQL